MDNPETRVGGGRRWALGLAPLALLAALVAVFVILDPTGILRTAFPPVEKLTIERVSLPAPGMMKIYVVNGGPEPVTVSQVMVDEAYWTHEMEGDGTIRRLGRATITVPYPWVEGDPHEVVLVTATGLTFSHEIEVATLTPQPSARYFAVFSLLGIYVGLIPVLIGLLWYPFLRRISRRWIHFYLSLTVGLLVFLGVDALAEAVETAEAVPDAFQGTSLILLGVLASLIVLQALTGGGRGGSRPGKRPAKPPGERSEAESRRLRLAYLIALGIGLHNLGEGLAIGSAYALGEIALGSFLVIGFAIHNTTEGLAIVAPVASQRPPLRHFLAMGVLAGVPTVAGTWIGGFSYSPILATLFLSLGAGAIIQVVLQIGKMLHRESEGGWLAPLNTAGFALGLAVMYGTALMVVA